MREGAPKKSDRKQLSPQTVQDGIHRLTGYGADVNIPDLAGKSPCDRATLLGWQTELEMLRWGEIKNLPQCRVLVESAQVYILCNGSSCREDKNSSCGHEEQSWHGDILSKKIVLFCHNHLSKNHLGN